jgi:MFS family permease
MTTRIYAAAVLELGALFGALSAGILADRYSRRYSIFLAGGSCLGAIPLLKLTVS